MATVDFPEPPFSLATTITRTHGVLDELSCIIGALPYTAFDFDRAWNKSDSRVPSQETP
jgi:hypothetical protein